jgi:tetratricopeptide (TPR) repeat protein
MQLSQIRRLAIFAVLPLLAISLLLFVSSGCPLVRSEAEKAYERGKTLAKQGNYDEAIVEFKRAIELKPDYSNAYVRLGEVYRTQKKYDEAFQAFRSGIEKDPQSSRGYVRLIKTYRDLGKLTEARDACLSALKSPAAQDAANKQDFETLLKQIEDLMQQAKPKEQS